MKNKFRNKNHTIQGINSCRTPYLIINGKVVLGKRMRCNYLDLERIKLGRVVDDIDLRVKSSFVWDGPTIKRIINEDLH